jgi:hypothetical protein
MGVVLGRYDSLYQVHVKLIKRFFWAHQNFFMDNKIFDDQQGDINPLRGFIFINFIKLLLLNFMLKLL